MPTTRIQLALNVENVAEATEFYERLFGVPAHKQREGYANLVIADPPLKLVLIEKPGATVEPTAAPHHVGRRSWWPCVPVPRLFMCVRRCVMAG